ncbi:hypothetical protein [Terriglobus roseus]|uniref:PH domain-containing protein n=1 Tax=Terriglobus roseus TaxID=392734 RepID=A0A1G7JIE1_9BACT|nr:hypothetical protein [Terriglobus roseus]SDF24666.1 hypothetical protein SAMN05444167_1831 [Terriglobus roseus]
MFSEQAMWQCMMALLWLYITSSRVRHEHPGHPFQSAFDITCLVIFYLAVAFNLWIIFFAYVEIDGGFLKITTVPFRSRMIPLLSVVSADHAHTKYLRLRKYSVELGIAPLGAEVYPHRYMTLRMPEADQFLQAIQPHLPMHY